MSRKCTSTTVESSVTKAWYSHVSGLNWLLMLGYSRRHPATFAP